VDARCLEETNTEISIDIRELFSKEFVFNPLKLPQVDVGGDCLAIIEELIISNTSCGPPDTEQNFLLIEIKFRGVWLMG